MIDVDRGREVLRPSALAGFDLAKLLRERERTLNRFAGKATPLSRFFPTVRAIPLGGKLRAVAELRLRDLAELQAYLEEAAPHPLEGLPPAWDDPDPATRPARLRAAWEAAEAWPPRVGTARAAALLAEASGRVAFALVALRRGDPSAALADALEVARDATPTQWAHLARVAWGKLPREEIADELAPEGGPDKPRDWAAILWALVERGLDYDRIGDLTLGQFRHLASGGKPTEQTEHYRAMVRRTRAALEA